MPGFEPIAQSTIAGLVSLHAWLDRRLVRRPVDSGLPLAEATDTVRTARAEMDSGFQRIGEGLKALLSSSEQCLKMARKGTSASLGDDLVRASELCRDALRCGEQSNESATQVKTNLDDLERASAQIRRMEAEIEDHMRPAEVVQVLLRIECARLDEVARAPLQALSTEIARTCEKMARTMEAEFELVQQTHLSVVAMIEHVQNLEQQQRSAQHRSMRLSETMAALRIQSEEQAVRDREFSQITSSLASAVSGLIGAMQYQDIVGQRLEHVEHGFEKISLLPADSTETHWNSKLQHAQLVEANAEMAGALTRIDESLDLVAAAKAKLAHELEPALTDSKRQQLNVRMREVLVEVWAMVKSNANEMRATDELIAPLVHVAGKMGCQIGDVSHEMRLIALNAQIQAARFGASTGLEVLAEALCQIADHMGTSGLTLDSNSRQIERTAIELRECFGQLRKQARMVCGECDRDFPGSIQELTDQQQLLESSLRSSLEALESLAKAEERMKHSLEETASPLESLADLASRFGAALDRSSQVESPQRSSVSSDLVTAEASRYTMASEKEVLVKLSGVEIEAPKSETGSPDSKVDEDGLELF